MCGGEGDLIIYILSHLKLPYENKMDRTKSLRLFWKSIFVYLLFWLSGRGIVRSKAFLCQPVHACLVFLYVYSLTLWCCKEKPRKIESTGSSIIIQSNQCFRAFISYELLSTNLWKTTTLRKIEILIITIFIGQNKRSDKELRWNVHLKMPVANSPF